MISQSCRCVCCALWSVFPDFLVALSVKFFLFCIIIITLRLMSAQVYQIPQSALSGPELQSVVACVVQCIGDQRGGVGHSDAVSTQAL
jgi:hypothetical protein